MSGPTYGSSAGSTILLVEDNDTVREALEDTLTGLGYKVYAACCGEKAVAVAQEIEEEIGLVISDMVMPGMNALELYEALGLQPGRDKMLIITGYPMPNTAESLLVRQGVRWARKPIGLDELQRVVGQMLAE